MRARPGAGRSRRCGESGAWCRGGATRARDRGERASGRDWGRGAEPGRGREEGPGWGRDPAAKRRPGAAESGMLAWAWWWGPRPEVVCTLGEPAAGGWERGPGLGALAGGRGHWCAASSPPPTPSSSPLPTLGPPLPCGGLPSSPWLLGTRDPPSPRNQLRTDHPGAPTGAPANSAAFFVPFWKALQRPTRPACGGDARGGDSTLRPSSSVERMGTSPLPASCSSKVELRGGGRTVKMPLRMG